MIQSVRDTLDEAMAGVLQRPGRAALTALGTVLGVGLFIAVLGLTATASSQIDERFNALTATEVTVKDNGGARPGEFSNSFPADASRRVEGLNGVKAAGVYWTVRISGQTLVRAAPVGQAATGERLSVTAAAPGVLQAAGVRISEGLAYDAWHDDRAARVAMLGRSAASRLGVGTLATNPAIFINDIPFTVVGIVSDADRKADLLMSVVIPHNTAVHLWGQPGENDTRAQMLISTDMGAAEQVADEAALALDPAHPERFTAVPPPDPRSLRNGVTYDLDRLFLLLGCVCLAVGAIGIANTTLVAVVERTSEIGLRRALGARGLHITSQILGESSILGLLGGLTGTSLGTAGIVIVAAARQWTPVLNPAFIATAPALGLATGLVAGAYPAWRASRIQPVEALRR